MGGKKHRKMEPYYRLAKKMGYRARSAFKLKQLNDRYALLRRGNIVLDLGAAPGGWLQVAGEIVGERGFVLGVDIQPIEELPLPQLRTIIGDILDPSTTTLISEKLPRKADVILSDASPKITGVWDVDHARSIELAEAAIAIADRVLAPNGRMLVKVFQGRTFEEFLRKFKRRFLFTKISKPHASRKGSAEVYVIGIGHRT